MTTEAHSTESSEENAPEQEERESGVQQDLHELVGELRAEITRLKAQQAKARAKNWIQRHPLLTMALSIGVGGAAGYGIATAVRPRRPQTLSEHARRRLERLSENARRVASQLRDQVGDRAARSGAQLRERARETSQRLAEEAQEAGQSAQREAQDFARSASERIREATDEASRRIRERRQAASEDARELGEALGERASEVVGEYSDAVSDKLSTSTDDEEGRTFTRSLLTLAGIAAGGYLASKVRNWR